MPFKGVKNKEFNLEDKLNFLLKEIESFRGPFDLEDIFKKIGDFMGKLGFSLVVFVPDKDKGDFKIKYINILSDKLQFPYKEEERIKFEDSFFYKEEINNKKSSFYNNKINIFNKNKKKEKKTDNNSIISPLVLRGEIIAFLEIISEKLNKEDLKSFDDFSENLVLRIANVILFSEIKKSEDKYRNLFEKSKDGFCIVNGKKKKFVDVNEVLCAVSGYSKEELLEINVVSIFKKSERKRVNNYIEERLSQKNNLKNKVPSKYETKILTKDKKELDVELNIIQIIDDEEWFVVVRDITRRKKAELALKESERKYKELIKNASDIILSVDEKGFLSFANKTFREVSGYSKDEITKIHFSQLIYPSDIKKVRKRFSKRRKGIKVSFSTEFRAITKKGDIKVMNMTSSSIVKNGEFKGVQAILRDVTKNKELLKQIEDSKRQYEQVIDAIQDSICVIDEDLKIVSMNKVFAKKTDLDIKKIKGRRCGEVLLRYKYNLFSDDCNKHDCETRCRLKKVLNTKENDSFVKKSIEEGNIFYHKISLFFNKKFSEEKNQVVVIIRDITKRKTAENAIVELNELNKSIMDNIPVSIITIEKDGTVTFANKYSINISSGTNLVGSNIFERNFFQQGELGFKYKNLLEKGKPFVKSNCKTINKNGVTSYINIIAVPIKNKDEKTFSGAVSMAWDNTEATIAKKKIEALNEKLEKKVIQRTWQLNQANKELAKVLDLKSKFISDASHELRTPLTIIQGNIDLAMHDSIRNKKEISEEYQAIYKEIQRMSGILSDLTVLTNADANKEKIEDDVVFPLALIKSVFNSLKILAKQKDIKLKEEIDKNISKKLYIKGDEAKLEKLLMNIMRNAIKYTEKGGWVKVGLKKMEKGIEITVEDNGIGIPKQDLPYIFERFYRVDKARSRQEGGTGLGLSICKWITEAHNGRISISSEENKGTKFSVELPYDFTKSSIDDSFL